MPLMYQTWDRLLFLHWRIPAEVIRPLVHGRLELETFDGEAWVSVAPFTMWGIRAAFLPPLPGLSRSHELNVRTYVSHEGVPGVWFLSLDAASRPAVWAGRRGFHLPYFHASMSLDARGREVHFRSRRLEEPAASFEASWTLGEGRRPAVGGTLDHFLVERYALYAPAGSELLRADIRHRPWPLRHATLQSLDSTMLQSHGLPQPADAPVIHAQAEPIRVEIFRPQVV